ncbi:asparagine synthase (glutamine-hydrolyzing) [Desulfatitalea alkaliphila]|uniref:asparagine synthase (glutamine-hydrolyzing) n=1 Tax=Desulfatitalea alkaliphila TaxID=2929485 RepID=A0AA41ULI8_9BACT|nr:asparagine synthase (glutamine-hydrolyzing) [Desulfatitalea alkaliphila]MCJ8502482.1 asparagine synthase (glutamine-hydrolyzing) [Desulfatitalea alkaliphila]
MCGIVGFFSRNDFVSLSRDLLTARDALKHRGPDDAGIFMDSSSGIGLGHRRLSIIDLSDAGRQPMSDADRRVWVVYNGEVYNFKEIRAELSALGHVFRGNSDTEVVLEAYIAWGVGCFGKFEGMFALAIWDGRKRHLVLARDPLGIKPLYFYKKDDQLLFASELKAIMAFNAFDRDVDEDAVSLLLHYQYIPTPRTVFKNTWKLQPGTYMIWGSAGEVSKKFWHLPPPTEEPDGNFSTEPMEEAVLDSLDDVLTRAVNDQMVSDVPLGALLSGGIDSSLVVALMQKISAAPVRTFSIGFDARGYDESPWAERIAATLGTHHTKLYVTPDEALEIIPRLPEIYDEPFADASAVPSAIVCRLTRGQVKVALSGDGGDEQYAGYMRYWMTGVVSRWLAALPPGSRRLLAAAVSGLPAPWLETGYLRIRDCLPRRFQVANFAEKWRKLGDILTFAPLSEIYRATICVWGRKELARLARRTPPLGGFESAFDHPPDLPELSRLMWVDQQTYLPDAMLTKVDRASMAFGLEVRVPLLDRRAVAHAATIPNHLKYRNGSGKHILKKLLTRYVPSELFERPKMGFAAPIDQWLRTKLKSMLTDYLSHARIASEHRFDPTMVEKTMDAHLSGRYNYQYRLWTLLMWEMWRERWLP